MLLQKVLHLNLDNLEYYTEKYQEYLGTVDLGIDLHLYVYKSYEHDVYDPRNVIIIGRGPFAGGGFFGAHRLKSVFRSPLTRGIFISSAGGAGYNFIGTGVNAVVIEGKSRSPVLIFIYGTEDGKTEVYFEEIDPSFLEKTYKGYGGSIGVRALAKYLLNTHWNFIKENKARMLLVGPAAFKSSFGGLYSPAVDYFSHKLKVEDWAARGGGGSVLARAHNVIGIIYGGKNYRTVSKVLQKFDPVKGITSAILGESYVKKVIDATSKYNYNPKTKSGGTFGNNYLIYRRNIPYFNWKTLDLDEETRDMLHEILIKYFHTPFNKTIIENYSFATCGEPCPVQCKKVDKGGEHIDYEPFNSGGPMIGVFRFEDAKRVVELIDSLGYDAIETGNVVGWIFDLLNNGLLVPSDLGLDEKPFFDPAGYEIQYSEKNADIAIKIIDEMTNGENVILRLIAEKGLRAAAKKLDNIFPDRIERVGIKFEDLAVYVPYGNEGSITPNYYLTPGMFAPLAILGRYWTLYSLTFLEPEEYAQLAIERALNEFLLEVSGWCRFHRGWVEKILPDLYKQIYGIEIDLLVYAREYYRKIIEYQKKANAMPQFWESKKVIEILRKMACKYESTNWCESFGRDTNSAAYQWWERFFRYMLEYFDIDVLISKRRVEK